MTWRDRFGSGTSSEPRRACRVGRSVGSVGSGSAVIRPPTSGLCFGGRPLGRGAGGGAGGVLPTRRRRRVDWLLAFHLRFDFFFGGLSLGFGA